MHSTHPIIDRLASLPSGQMLSPRQLGDVLGRGYTYALALCQQGKVGCVSESVGLGESSRRNRDMAGRHMAKSKRYDISPLAVVLYLIRSTDGDVNDILEAVAARFPGLHKAAVNAAAARGAQPPLADPSEKPARVTTPRSTRPVADPFKGHPDLFLAPPPSAG